MRVQSRPNSKTSAREVEKLIHDDDESNSLVDEELLVISKPGSSGLLARHSEYSSSGNSYDNKPKSAEIKKTVSSAITSDQERSHDMLRAQSGLLSRPQSGAYSRSYTPIEGESSSNVLGSVSSGSKFKPESRPGSTTSTAGRKSLVKPQPPVEVATSSSSRPSSGHSAIKMSSRPSSRNQSGIRTARNGGLSSSEKLYMADQFDDDDYDANITSTGAGGAAAGSSDHQNRIVSSTREKENYEDDDDDDLGAGSYVWDTGTEQDQLLDDIIDADHAEALAQYEGLKINHHHDGMHNR